MSNNVPCSQKRSRVVLAFVAALFAVAIFAYQMYFARPAAAATSVFINEIHYDNTGTDAGEAIEIAGPAGTDLTGWSIVLYNGANGLSYDTDPLTGVIPNQQNGFGTVFLSYSSNGIQNGSPDGIALVNAANVAVQFLSYEGLFTALNGPANGMTSTDIGIIETGSEPLGQSLQLSGSGQSYEDFTWNAQATATFGLVNAGQSFGAGVSLSINNVTVTEGESGPVAASFTVTVSSSSHSGVTFDISTQDDSATTADNDYVATTLLAQSIPSGQQTYNFDVTINGDTTFEPNETFFVNVTDVSGATVSDGQGVGTITNDDCPAAPADIVISQVYGGGGNTGATFTHDFIELFNQSTTTVDLSGWSVQYISATGTGTWAVTPLSGSIAPGGYYLVQEAQGAGGTRPLPTPDAVGTIAMAAGAGKVALSSSMTAFSGACPTCFVDLVGYGGATCFEGAGPTSATSNTTATLRKRSGCFDSDNNNIDFSIGSPDPRNSASPTNSCTAIAVAIHDVQGNGASTPYAGQFVSTSGIVTARKTNGFFMQEADANQDLDPTTSEGIFVFTSVTPTAAVGDAVAVLGTANEFFNLTQLESSLPGDVTIMSSGNTVPVPVTLTPLILDPTGTTDQLERFEGMRMHADTLVSVAPTDDFGEIATVLPGVARPFREPGIEISLPVPPDPTTGVPDCCIPRWDENPERIFIDSEGLLGSSVLFVTSNVTLSNVTGPLDFTFSNYKVLPETPPGTTANMSAVPLPTPVADEFTVAGYNIENFNNDPTQRQKAALALRTVLHYPDVIGNVEIANLASLQALADQVNDDAVAAGDPNPAYEARLIPASPTAMQNVGFLVKTSQVQIDSVTQEELPGCVGTAATCNTFTDPNNNQPALLNDRPPLILRATVDPSGVNPRQIIVIVNHLRSFIDIETVIGEGPRVRAKRKAQGEFLADLLQDLQANNPTTPIISIGDYNAYEFNDGYTDPIATIKGMPTADDEVVVDESPDLVNPNFINLTDGLPAEQRYSFIFEGTPQALDHVIVNSVATSYLERYAIARNNADFPENPALTSDATRPERNSDHDMPVAYFNFPPTITLSTNPITFFPPNHSYRTVTVSDMVTSAGDTGDPSITIDDVVIAQVTSDELENAPGSTDGNTINDIVIAADCKSVQLRAERDGALDGRVYTVTLKVTDASGNVTTATRRITVTLSPGQGQAIDSGPMYSVTGGCP
jgi:uncharacterized protein